MANEKKRFDYQVIDPITDQINRHRSNIGAKQGSGPEATITAFMTPILPELVRDAEHGYLHTTGKNGEEIYQDILELYPNLLVEKKVLDRAEEVFCTADAKGEVNLTKVGQYITELAKTQFGNDMKLATEQARANAAIYGYKLGDKLAARRPGQATEASVAAAKSAAASPSSGSPLNPKRTYPSQAAREAEIAVYIRKVGIKTVQDECKAFGVDIAGRPNR